MAGKDLQRMNWYEKLKENMKRAYQEVEEDERREEERDKAVLNRWMEEKNRENEDWKQLSPFQRTQIRTLKKIHEKPKHRYESAYTGWGEP